MKVQRGFTLIELIVVIVILGILAATALPKFVDLSSDAAQAGVKGVAGGITSAASVNYGAFKANSAKGQSLATETDLCATTAIDKIMQTPIDTAYTVAQTGGAVNCTTASAGTAGSCSVSTTTGGTTYSAVASVICTK